MSQYVVSIQPAPEDRGPHDEVPETVVRIDVQGERVLVRELTIRAAEGAALTTAEPPYIDFELLLKAFVRPGGGTAKPPARAAAKALARQAAATPAVAAGAGHDGTAEHDPLAEPAMAGSAPASPAPASSVQRVRPGRNYRRAPDPDVLAAVYGETNSIAGVAERFGVPTHTAQGWISRLRQKNAAGVAG